MRKKLGALILIGVPTFCVAVGLRDLTLHEFIHGGLFLFLVGNGLALLAFWLLIWPGGKT